MCWHTEHRFDSGPDTPRQARALVVTELRQVLALPDDETLHDVALIVSELVTNAVKAGSDAITTMVDVHRDTLRVAVIDRAPGWPSVQPPSATSSHGRGLQIVQMLSTSWGVADIADGGGKQVWAVLPVSEHSTHELACTEVA